MKILVTGCCGFIGSHLSERLLKLKHDVVGIDCFTDYYSKKLKEQNLSNFVNDGNFEFIEKNLLEVDLKQLIEDGVDYIFHEAAQAGVRYSWGENFDIYTENNILATQRLLEACKESRVKKMIYASSSSVYGDVNSFPMKETDTVKPVSPYGVSKLATEHLCSLYYKNFDVHSISLRYFTVYGPRQRPDMAFNKFIKAIDNDEVIEIYGDGKQTRDYTYISDIIDANILAMNSKIDNAEVFNIGGGARTGLITVIELIEKLIDKKAKLKYIDSQKGDMQHTASDISKAKNKLGYQPKVNLNDGLQNQIIWKRRG